MGHIQSETPYYQPVPVAPKPFDTQKAFPGDPKFACKGSESSCKESWALRIIDSSNIYIHGLGLYSFFINYDQSNGCIWDSSCQDRLLEVKGVKNVVLFNIFTIGAKEVGTGAGNTTIQADDTKR